MLLHDRYDGSDDPFEGDRAVMWRSLPANAAVTKASVTLETALPPGRSDYTETVRFAKGGPAYGATIRPPVTAQPVEIDFHARRTAIAFAGLEMSPATTHTALSADIGGGVFLAVGADGTIPAAQGSRYDLSGGVLPGITALRLQLTGMQPTDAAAGVAGVTVDIASMPSNLSLRFGVLPPFWSMTGELAVPTTTPDITSAVQRALAGATVENGYYAIPLLVHSDTLGRVKVVLDIEYLGAAPLVPAGIPEVVLAYDFASLPKADGTSLQAELPAGAVPVSPQTAVRIRGAFASSQVADGPTGTTNEATTIACSAAAAIAQPVIPAADVNVSALDLFAAAEGPAARLALDIRADDDGKPGQASMLSKPVPVDLTGDASGQRRWVSAQVASPARLQVQQRYWVVVQALDGTTDLGVDATPDPARLPQVSRDSGFSWRLAGLGSPLLLRLRTVPDRFQMPVDFAAGVGPQQQRVSLSGYDPAGKVDMVIDRPEIATAVQSYLAQAVPAPCAQAELLSNTDFSQWSAVGGTLAYLEETEPPQKAAGLVLVDTFFDTSAAGPPIRDQTPRQLAFSADGSTIFVLREGIEDGIDAINTLTYASTPLADTVQVIAMAVAPQGGTLYLLRESTSSRPADLAAVDLTTGDPPVVFARLPGAPVREAAALALSPDGRVAYVACDGETPVIVAIDLQTGTQAFQIQLDAFPLAVTAGSKAIVVVGAALGAGEQAGQGAATSMVYAFDALTGSPDWSTSLPVQADTGVAAAAIAADGVSVYAAGLAPTSSGMGSGESAALCLNLVAFDGGGRMIAPTPLEFTAPAGLTDTLTLAVKPQGDRVYVGWGPLAINPRGDHLVATSRPIAVIAAGDREPSAWTLTAGTVVPVQRPGEPPGIDAQLTDGALSQVVPVAPGCFHDLTVNAMVPESTGGPDAAAETFWLDATGALLRSDSLTLPASNLFVTRRTRAEPPAGSAQAEVRVSVTGGQCTLRTVSLKSTDELLQDDAWQPDPAAPGSIVVTGSAAGTTYHNAGTQDAALVQPLTLDPSLAYELDFSGDATPGVSTAHPYLELRYSDASGAKVGAPQQIALAGIRFAGWPAQLTVPSASIQADLRVVLPPDATVTVERLQVLAQHLGMVPVTFIAQSPGELHVSSAQIVYDVPPTPTPSPPSGGLSQPTPPGSTPGDKPCPDPQAAPAAAHAAVRLTLPGPVRPAASPPGSPRFSVESVATGPVSVAPPVSTASPDPLVSTAPPVSVANIDLSPVPGKVYFDTERDWWEEFIYFLMVDRFQDSAARTPVLSPDRSLGVQTPSDFYGGTLAGVRDNLDYIAGLGCTAIWLSPVFENNPGSYHGYDINNYLSVDPHFGTKQDLIDLVDAAHRREPPIRIILDAVINHSGDNWFYPGNVPYYYYDDMRFDFGGWRRPDRPRPTELVNPDFYHRRGSITGNGWDTLPEMQLGDIGSLKDFYNDDDATGSALLDILIKTHCYWIKEADVDGFRMDAVKHMGAPACARFSSAVREYAEGLGKRNFFLYGEAANPDDDLYDRYIGPNTSVDDFGTVFFGLDSILDFRLAMGVPLRDVIKGFAPAQPLLDRWTAQENRALNHGQLGRYLVTFVDNHDSFWQPAGRIGAHAPSEQVIAAIGYLLCALGTACIYYGTEQGFQGSGGDNQMREAMFDTSIPGSNLLNTSCGIYQEIAKIARVMRSQAPLRFGQMSFRQISGDGQHFGFPNGTDYTLAFSRLLYPTEVLVAYNVSSTPRADFVVVDSNSHAAGDQLTFLYGGAGSVPVAVAADGTHYVQLNLNGHQFCILR